MKTQNLFRQSLVLVLGLFFSVHFINAQFIELSDEEASCTSIMVGVKATTDGSVITSHSCDGNYRTWLNIVPHQKHEAGSTRKILWGTMHTETSWDVRNVFVKGEIPQVEETYAYFNVCYPAMNEKQLAIGETTIGGRRDLRNDEGLFVIEQLQAIALERCDNARDAIQLMGDLAMEYGYGDSGECLTVADKKEVWHFEIFGSSFVYDKPKAVWAAVRIPDDHVGVSANIPRISTLNLKDKDYYMASENVISLAEELGYYNKKEDGEFRFWKAYGGRPKAFSIREYFILSTMAPSLNLSQDVDELPFSVKPDKKVSVQDVFAYYRQTYEGTEFDMSKNLVVQARRRYGQQAPAEGGMVTSPVVNNFMSYDMSNLINTLKPGTIEQQRTIAIAGCSYSQVCQVRGWLPDEIGGIAWFSFDNPGQSPRIPVYSGVLSLPESFEVCAQKRYRTDAAAWHFRRANRLAQVRWGVTREYLEGAVAEFEEKAMREIPLIDQKAVELYNKEKGKESVLDENGNPVPPEYRVFLTKYTNDFARAAMSEWWELGDRFWTMFARGF
jgi:dipeptidase